MVRRTSIASGGGESSQSTATVGSLFEPNSPSLMSETFVVSDSPVVVLAFNLPVGTEISFEQVIYSPGEGETAAGCCVTKGKDGAIVGVMPYKRCECEPKLSKHQVQCGTTPAGLPIWKTKEVSRLVLPDAGVYRAILNQPIGAGRVVHFNDANATIDEKSLGCCGGNEVNLNAIKTTTQPRYKAGQDFDYTIRLVNPGSASANNANIKDTLPAEFVLTGGINLTYGNGAAGQATLTAAQLANWNIPSFPATGYVDITARGHFDKEGAYLNKVCIYPPCGVNESSWGDNCAQVLLNIDPIQPKLVVDKTVSNANPLVGDTGSFTLTITNTGSDPDTNVILKDVLPAGLTYVEPFAVTSAGTTGTPATVTAAQLAAGVNVAATFPVGATVTVQIPYTVTAAAAGKTLSNTATATGALSESEDTVSLSPATPTADLSITKTANKETYAIGEAVVYTINFANAGASDANGAVIKDVIPASIGSVAVTATYAGGAGSGSPTQAQLAAGWAVPTLPAGGSGVLTVTGVATQAGVFTNQATITAPSGRIDTNAGNNNAIAVISVAQPARIDICENPINDSADRYFKRGNIKTCVNGALVDLDCNMIVKTIPDCNTTDCATAVRMTNPSTLVGAGVCVDVQATGFDNGIAVIRGRDLTSELGTVAQGGSTGAHLTYTHVNNTNCPQLVGARLVANGNIARWAPVGTRLSFVYNIGKTLVRNMPTTSSQPGLPNFETMRQTIFAAASNTRGGTPGINEYQESTVSGAELWEVVPPGGSFTPIAQWWAVLYEDTQLPVLTPIHGHMGMRITVYENGAWL